MDGTQGCLEYSLYFDEYGDVHSDYSKMFISIFDGWLGKGNLGQLDTVTELEWKKFSHFLEILFEQYELFSVLGEYKNINQMIQVIL